MRTSRMLALQYFLDGCMPSKIHKLHNPQCPDADQCAGKKRLGTSGHRLSVSQKGPPMPATLEHISDLVLHASGISQRAVFRNALRKMNQVLKPGYCEGPRHSDCCMRIQIEAPDSAALLVDFLSEALALCLIQKTIFCYVYFDLLEERRLSARLFGRWHDGLENEIKAITYREAEGSYPGAFICISSTMGQ